MGKKSHVPEYSSATFDSGLFGTAKADKSGVTANPAGWMNTLSNTVTGSLTPTVNTMNSTLGNILSGDYLNDANFKQYKSAFDRQAKNTFDTAVLGNVTDRGLLRSSGLQALNDSYQNAMNNNLTNLMDNYYNRQVSNYGLVTSNLGNLLNTQNALYNWITGNADIAQKQANAVSGYNAQKAHEESLSCGMESCIHGDGEWKGLCINVGEGGVLLDEVAARAYILAHEHGEDIVGSGGVLDGHLLQ